MGNNIQKTNQKKKIYRPISFTTPAKIIPRIPNHSQSPSDEFVGHINIKNKHKPSDEPVQVKAEPFGKKTHDGFFGNKAPPPPSSSTVKTGRFGRLESNDERFTDYINKAKPKIRAMTTNLGDLMDTDAPETENTTATASDSQESDEDQFSDYIKRAKMKIRATSSLGRGNRTYESFRYTKD